MSYTNIDLDDKNEELYKRLELQEAELNYYKRQLRYTQEKLENIPEAIKEWGFVDISTGKETMRLVKQD